MTQTVCITGATSGFGKGCAELFASEGYQLILCGRRQERLMELQQRLNQVEVHTLCFDVRDREQVKEALNSLPRKFREIAILINNAGLALGLEPAHEASMEDWEIMVDTNIKGLLYMTRQILPGMVKRGEGHVVNLGSVAGVYPYPGGNTYGGTKAFVRQYSRNLRSDVHGTGVRITNIEPGLAETEFSQVRFHGDIEKADDVYKGTQPLVAEDIAETIFWVVNRPPHVNINTIELMPTCQSWAPLAVHRDQKE